MENPLETTEGRPRTEASQSALIRALMLERFGGMNPAAATDSDGAHPVQERAPASEAQPFRRRYRGWALASRRRR